MKISLKVNDGRKISTIKELKNIFNAGLRDTKEFAEHLIANHGDIFLVPPEIMGENSEKEMVLALAKSKYFRPYFDFKGEIEWLALLSISLGDFNMTRALIDILDEQNYEATK